MFERFTIKYTFGAYFYVAGCEWHDPISSRG